MNNLPDEEKKIRILRVVRSDSIKNKEKDWSNLYPDAKEVGRGLIENEGVLTNVIIRYYVYKRPRFEKLRYFAEVFVTEKEKFILDGTDIFSLVQYVTDEVWPIIQCRKKIKKSNNTTLRLVKK